MVSLHEASLGRKPSPDTLLGYRKAAKRSNWAALLDQIGRSMDSIRRNYRLRHSGIPLGPNEGSKLYLFGELIYSPAKNCQLVWFGPFSKIENIFINI